MKFLSTLFLLFCFASIQAQLDFQEIYHEYDDTEVDNIQSLLMADFNNDGIQDFCGANPFFKDVWVALNTENLGRPSFTKITDDIDARKIAVADFNEDGNMDIVGSDVFGDRFVAFLGDGQGGFTPMFIDDFDYETVYFVDLNNDGKIEMIHSKSDRVAIYDLNNGSPTEIKALTTGLIAGAARAINSFDYNGDGKLDIIAAYSSDILIFQQNSLTDFVEFDFLSGIVFSTSSITPSKINDDAYWDFYTYGGAGTRAIISNGALGYDVEILPISNGSNVSSLFGDIDNDGDDDVLMITVDGVNTGSTLSLIHI